MADIKITCRKCSAETVVSEYIDAAAAVCRVCGQPLDMPRGQISRPRPPPREKTAPPAPSSPLLSKERQERSTMTAFRAVQNRERRSKRMRRLKILAWSPSNSTLLGLFLFICSTLCVLQYTNILGANRESFAVIGMVALIGLHFVIVVDAFNDNMMHGLLALFVPLYSVYYVFTACDSTLLRLFMAVFIPPFGPGVAILCCRYAVQFVKFVSGIDMGSD